MQLIVPARCTHCVSCSLFVGVPQAKEANLTEHLHRIRGIFSGRVPAATFGGVCNIDFEGWQTNVWEWIWCPANGNVMHGAEYRAGYQTFSELLVKRVHPDWTAAQVGLHHFSPARLCIASFVRSFVGSSFHSRA